MTARVNSVNLSGSEVAPTFMVTPESLDVISAPGRHGGVLLGMDQHKQPLTVSILRPTPTRVAMIGGLYLARQVAMRALATGAWIVIATGRPAAWQSLVRAAGPGPDGRPSPLVHVRRLSPVELPPASEDRPMLMIHDGGAAPQEMFPPRTPWQTTAYVLPYLHPQASLTANQADLVLIQRLTPPHAHLAGQIWHLPPQLAQQLTMLPDNQVIALGKNLWVPITLVSNQREIQLLGPIRRTD